MHPFVKILCFIALLVLSSFLSHQLIYLLCIVVTGLALKLQFKPFVRTIMRMRWLFMSIFIIYAFATPGQYIEFFPLNYAPTFEGSALGILQIIKLIIALASLSILFSMSSKQQLMLGLYLLLTPLKLFGINTERFTARILLTLSYVEALAEKEQFKLSFSRLDELHAATNSLQVEEVIMLQSPAFNYVDKLLVVSMVSSALMLAAFKVFT